MSNETDRQAQLNERRKRIREEQEARRAKHMRFFQRIKDHLEEAKELQKDLDRDFGVADDFYRFYHQSFKAYRAQNTTRSIIILFEKIAGDEWELNQWFEKIVKDGTGQKFDLSHNNDWLKHTRPQIEAMLHAKFFLDLIVKHGEKMKNEEEPPQLLDSGWAAVCYLFNER